MATFALVGCAQDAQAAEGPAYLVCRANAGFAAAWEWASRAADVALILSPEYGLVHPDEVLSPSDGGLGEERWQQDPEAWLVRVQRELGTLRWLEAQHRWLVLATGEWADRLVQVLRDGGQDVQLQPAPLAGS